MRLAVLIVLLFSAKAAASPFDAVEPAKSAFSHSAPEGFRPLPKPLLPQNCLAAYVENGEQAPVLLYLFESDRVLRQREEFTPETEPGDDFSSIFRESWQGVHIFGVRNVTGPDEALAVRIRLYLPLIDRTVWLQAESGVGRELDALIALRRLLATCKGQSNWQPDAPTATQSAGIQASSYRFPPQQPYAPPPGYQSKEAAPQALAIRSSIDALFWASLICAAPFALAWGLWMLRRRPQVAFKATTRPLYNEPKGWGGPVPLP